MSKKQKAKNEQQRAPSSGWDGMIPGWLSCLLICIVGILVYSNTFQSSFHFDDEPSIVANAAIKNLADVKAIWGFSPARFVTYLTFAFNYHLGGLNVVGYHIINLLVHIATALVVWQLALQLFRTPALEKEGVSKRAPLLALGAALIFVAHPIQTQAVTYIVQRAASLATLFYVLSLTSFLEGRQVQIDGGKRLSTVILFSISALAGLLALFSKEIAVTLPVAMLMVEFFFLRSKHRVNWKFILGVLGLFALVVAFLVSRNLMSLVDTTMTSRGQYLLTQSKVLLSYIGLLVVPVGQSVDHFVPVSRSVLEQTTFFSILLLVALALLGIRLYSRKRVISFGIFWFLLTLLPESSIIPLKDLMFEHRLYLPMVGLSLLLVDLVYQFSRRGNPTFLISILVMLTGILGWVTYDRNEVWKDDLTLWSDVIAKSPTNPRGYHGRGLAYADRGMLELALADYSRAISLDPSFAPPHQNRASIYIKKGMLDAAIADCSQALALGNVMSYQEARIFINRGRAYMMKNQIDSAFADLNQAIQIDPNDPTAYLDRAIIFIHRKEKQKAIDDYSRSLALDPQNPIVLNNRGMILKDSGKLGEAITDFGKAIKAQPNFPQPYLNRGLVMIMKGDFDSSIADFSAFLRLAPNNFDGYFSRGMAYERKLEHERAIADFTRACDLNPSYGPVYIERARARIGLGQFANAAGDVKRAKSLGATVDKELEATVQKGLGR